MLSAASTGAEACCKRSCLGESPQLMRTMQAQLCNPRPAAPRSLPSPSRSPHFSINRRQVGLRVSTHNPTVTRPSIIGTFCLCNLIVSEAVRQDPLIHFDAGRLADDSDITVAALL